MTPTSSEAFAEMVIVPGTVAPFVGDVIETLGKASTGGLLTFTVTVAEVAVLLAASRAVAVRV